jgi:hypothetical protein
MCISETWLSNQNKDTIKQQLSNTSISNERDTKNGGGTMILINKEYTTSIQHITTKKIENSEAEISLAKIKPNRLPRGYSFCYVACIYIPPKAATKNNSSKTTRTRN